MCFLFASFSTKNSLQDMSKQCYLFDGHLWTAKFALPAYRYSSGIATYRGVLNRYSSLKLITPKDAPTLWEVLYAKMHKGTTAPQPPR